MRLDASLNSSATSLAMDSRPAPGTLRGSASPASATTNGYNRESAVILRSDSLRSLPTIRVSSPPQLPAALVRSPSRVCSVAHPSSAGVNRRLVNYLVSRKHQTINQNKTFPFIYVVKKETSTVVNQPAVRGRGRSSFAARHSRVERTSARRRGKQWSIRFVPAFVCVHVYFASLVASHCDFSCGYRYSSCRWWCWDEFLILLPNTNPLPLFFF